MNISVPRFLIFLFAILGMALAAWSQQSRAHHDSPSAEPASADQWSELVGSMDGMHAAMASVAPSGNGDVDFVNLMLPHHQAAIDMAKTQLNYGKDPQMRRLAQEIIADQHSEIELMHLWLKQHQSNSQQITPRSPASARGLD